MSPLTSTWLNPESDNKDKHISNTLTNVDEELVYLSSYPLSSLSIGTESSRINGLLRPIMKKDLIARRRTISREASAEVNLLKASIARMDKPIPTTTTAAVGARSHAYSCDTEDTDDGPSEEPDSPGEVLMRDQLRQQVRLMQVSSIVVTSTTGNAFNCDVVD